MAMLSITTVLSGLLLLEIMQAVPMLGEAVPPRPDPQLLRLLPVSRPRPLELQPLLLLLLSVLPLLQEPPPLRQRLEEVELCRSK